MIPGQGTKIPQATIVNPRQRLPANSFPIPAVNLFSKVFSFLKVKFPIFPTVGWFHQILGFLSWGLPGIRCLLRFGVRWVLAFLVPLPVHLVAIRTLVSDA